MVRPHRHRGRVGRARLRPLVLRDRFAVRAPPGLPDAPARAGRALRGPPRAGNPAGAGHWIRLDSEGSRDCAPWNPTVDSAGPATGQDPGYLVVHRLGRVRWHLRSGPGHWCFHWGGDLATAGPCGAWDPPHPGAVRDRGNDGVLWEHLSGAGCRDGDGGRDDRDPGGPSPGDDRSRAGDPYRPARGRHHLPEPARKPGGLPGASPPRGDALARDLAGP